jgi:CheY-like chemotaxis protein
MSVILVLEDEPALAMFLRKVLQQYTLVEAVTANQAIQRFVSHDHHVDLLIADVSLPASSGIQVALTLREAIPDLPVILTSGYPMNALSVRDYADLRRLGPKTIEVMQKPFKAQVLVDKIQEMIKKAHAGQVSTA